MCLRRKKVSDVSTLDLRKLSRSPSQSPPSRSSWGVMIKWSWKIFYHMTSYSLSAVRNYPLHRIVIGAGLLVFFIALIRAHFNT